MRVGGRADGQTDVTKPIVKELKNHPYCLDMDVGGAQIRNSIFKFGKNEVG
jgi:hypothetical protein